MTAVPAVEFSDLRVVRDGRVILEAPRLVVVQGERVGVIGPNGAGKTTLLTLINGFTVPSEGVVRVLGIAATTKTRREIRKQAAMLFQSAHPPSNLPMTALESVLLGAWPRLGFLRRPSRALFGEAAELLERFGAAHVAGQGLGVLSGGERARVAFARALIQQPRILLLDEPAAALDVAGKRMLSGLLRDAKGGARTIVCVTHDLSALPEFYDRVLVLKSGRVLYDGPAEQALDETLLSEAFSTRASIATVHGRSVVVLDEHGAE